MYQKNFPDSENDSFGTNENSIHTKGRRLSFNVNNSHEIENSINKELELFNSDAPKNKDEVS